jgi:hypothetical protein
VFGLAEGTAGLRTAVAVEFLASGDCVAIDAVAAKMMGFNPMSIPYLRFAHEEGLGIGRTEEIEIVGDDVSNVNFRFSVGDNVASKVGDALWFGRLKPLQKLFFRTPLVYLFVFGSFLYHDYLWWPIKGKKIQRERALNTKWGRLFESYPKTRES